MIEGFKSAKEYKDGDTVIINGVEYVIKAVEKEKKTLEKRVLELENEINTIDHTLKVQATLNLTLNKRIDMIINSMQSTSHIAEGVPPFYIH